jgi:hypothetical protein
VVIAVGTANGGYVYKTSCVRSDGHVETSWQYRINDIVPYVGYHVSGSVSHTATRELLSVVGVWKLRGHVSVAAAANQAAATRLVELKNRVDAMDLEVYAVKPSTPITLAAVTDYVDRLQPVIADYALLDQSTRSERSKLATFADPDLLRAWNLLVRRADLTVNGYQLMTEELRAGDYKAFGTNIAKKKTQLDQIDAQFHALALRINSRYQ